MSQVGRVLANYPLSMPIVVERFEANYRNDNWLVEDNGIRRYVLRRHRQHRQGNRVAFQLRFQQHLHRQRFPTPEVVETCKGATFVMDEDGFPWSLYIHVDGGFYQFDRIGHVVEAARRLAQFHAVAEAFEGEAATADYSPPIREWWVSAEGDLEYLYETFSGISVGEELAYIRGWWQWVMAEWPLPRVDGLPVGWMHGDYHGRNMVFVENEMRALFDFDDLSRGPLVFDVARAVHMFGRESRSSLRIRPDVARCLLREYAKGRGLTGEELSALPMLVAMYYPPRARYYVYCRQLGEDIEARLRREVRMMRTLRAQMPDIAAIVASI